jgi:hypothetical protein
VSHPRRPDDPSHDTDSLCIPPSPELIPQASPHSLLNQVQSTSPAHDGFWGAVGTLEKKESNLGF